jgi:hypothetical protein
MGGKPRRLREARTACPAPSVVAGEALRSPRPATEVAARTTQCPPSRTARAVPLLHFRRRCTGPSAKADIAFPQPRIHSPSGARGIRLLRSQAAPRPASELAATTAGSLANCARLGPPAPRRQSLLKLFDERLRSPRVRHEVRRRGLRPPSAVLVKPCAVCRAFRRCCGGFSRSGGRAASPSAVARHQEAPGRGGGVVREGHFPAPTRCPVRSWMLRTSRVRLRSALMASAAAAAADMVVMYGTL